MNDIADQAANAEAMFLVEALTKHFQQHTNQASLSHCQDCGNPIPFARQQAAKGCTRCLDCQTIIEYQ